MSSQILICINESNPINISFSITQVKSIAGIAIVSINGSLISGDYGIFNESILVSFSNNGGFSWSDIASVNTRSDGKFSIEWIPPSSYRSYIVKVEWKGNMAYVRSVSTISLSLISWYEYVFAISSNSTIRRLKLDSTTGDLSFTISSTIDSKGSFTAFIPKIPIQKPENIEIVFYNEKLFYSAVSLEEIWVINSSFESGTYDIIVKLGPLSSLAGNQGFISSIILFLVVGLFFALSLLLISYAYSLYSLSKNIRKAPKSFKRSKFILINYV